MSRDVHGLRKMGWFRRGRAVLLSVNPFRASVVVTAVAVMLYAVVEMVLGASPLEALYAAFQALEWNLSTAPEWPSDGGAWIIVAWVLRFAVPATGFGVFLELLARFDILPRRWFTHGHVIVVGGGNLGTSVARRLHDRYIEEGGPAVVVLEQDDRAPGVQELRDAGVWVVVGDGASAAALSRAYVERAAFVIAVTGSDVVNVEAAYVAQRLKAAAIARGEAALFPWRTPKAFQRVLVHVGDRRFGDSMSRPQGPESSPCFEVFESHDIAASHTVANLPDSAQTIAIIGFGKFGMAVFKHVAAQPRAVRAVHVFDKNAQRETDVTLLRERHRGGFSSVDFHVSDLRSDTAVARLHPFDAVIVCTDSDVRNLDLAVRLRDQKQTTVVSRIFKEHEMFFDAVTPRNARLVPFADFVWRYVVVRLFGEGAAALRSRITGDTLDTTGPAD